MTKPITTFADLDEWARYDDGRPRVTIKLRNGCWYTTIEPLRGVPVRVERGANTLAESIERAVTEYRTKRASGA